jgi:hypothetical protein
MEVYVRDDTPSSELLQRIRDAVVAALPSDKIVRRWGDYTTGDRLGETNMIRYRIEYAAAATKP